MSQEIETAIAGTHKKAPVNKKHHTIAGYWTVYLIEFEFGRSNKQFHIISD
jgi:hypothetical protein